MGEASSLTAADTSGYNQSTESQGLSARQLHERSEASGLVRRWCFGRGGTLLNCRSSNDDRAPKLNQWAAVEQSWATLIDFDDERQCKNLI